MIARLCLIGGMLGVVCACATATGQEVVYYSPIGEKIFVAPPAVTYGPVILQRPVVVAPAPVTFYRPIAPAPAVTVYSPIEAAPIVVPATPVVVGRTVIVRPKVYVRGQPIRNVLRAVTP